MKGSKEFFQELQEGQEYYNCLMTSEVYNGITHELRELICVSSIRQKNSQFENDEQHQELVRQMSKARAKLQEYEFKTNHNIK